MWCSFASNPIVVIIGRMNTRRNVAQRLEEEIANVGALSCGEKVPPLEQDVNVEQEPLDPPPFTDKNIRTSLLQLAQDITTQAQAATTQAQSMMAQEIREVVPRFHRQVTTMASRIRDFN